jgi:hypothetical protein
LLGRARANREREWPWSGVRAASSFEARGYESPSSPFRNAQQRTLGASRIVNAKLNTVRVAELKFRERAAQMLLGAALICSDHTSFEDAVAPTHGLGFDFLAGRIRCDDG